jgi:hypothetical protein
MPVQCVQTAGRDTCPEGYYALYEHANYNAPCPDGAGPTVGQTVIANESVASLNGYDWHAGLPPSVVNRTQMHLELFIDCAFRGRSMIVTPGQSIDRLPPSFDNAISSARLVTGGNHEGVLVLADGIVTEQVPVGEGIVRRGGLVLRGEAGGEGSVQGIRP